MPYSRGLRSLVRPGILSLAIAVGAPAAGVPMLLIQAELDGQLAGLAVVLEDSERFGVSDYVSPFGVANGSSASPLPRVEDSSELCDNMNRCLLDPASTAGIRTFAAPPAGAQLWGADVFMADVMDKLQITVTGKADILEMVVSGSRLFGLADGDGFVSIASQNFGTDSGHGTFDVSSYSSDRTRTGARTLAGLGGLALLGLALAAVWVRRRRSAI